MAEFKFDRSKQTIEATRQFQRGRIALAKGEAAKPAELASVPDDVIEALCTVQKVAKVVPIEAKAKAETGKTEDAKK